METGSHAEKIKTIRKWLGTGSINIFGLPFAGKDSHGHELAALFGASIIGGGDILRGDGMTKDVQERVARGELAPTDEYLSIVLPYFSKEEFNGKPLVLSSVGRWHGEEFGVLEASKSSGHPLKAVLWLEITESEMRRRWSLSQEMQDRGGRDDDAEHVLEKRLQEFREKTIPVMKFYSDQNLLIEIDGKPEKYLVSENIINELHKKAL